MTAARISKCLAVTALAIGLTSCAREKPVLDFSLKDSTGKAVHLSDYRGKVVLLNFWATWCAPCKIEIPWFMEFQRQHKSGDFNVLGVSMDEDGWDSVRPYMSAHQFNYTIVIGNDAVGKLFGEIDDLPTTFLIDRAGHVVTKHVGLISKSTYDDEITALIKGQVLRGAVEAPSAPALAFVAKAFLPRMDANTR